MRKCLFGMRKEIIAKDHILNSIYMTKSRKIISLLTNLSNSLFFSLSTGSWGCLFMGQWCHHVVAFPIKKNISYKENTKLIQTLLLYGWSKFASNHLYKSFFPDDVEPISRIIKFRETFAKVSLILHELSGLENVPHTSSGRIPKFTCFRNQDPSDTLVSRLNL